MGTYEALKKTLRGYGRVAIAYSGGVDSSLLLRAACDALGRKQVLAVSVFSCLHTEEEISSARESGARFGVEHIIETVNPLEIPKVKSNSPSRCYFCKRMIFETIFRVARQRDITIVCDGTNATDTQAYRPGLRALEELHVCSPLRDCHITKEDARVLLKTLGMDEARKPSNSCLATRVPYHTELTKPLLKRIAQAEELLHRAGFFLCRVRVAGDLARIEIPKTDFCAFLKETELVKAVKQLGFAFVTLDAEGYRSGCYDSMEGNHENTIL